jgi:hypothetical protein
MHDIILIGWACSSVEARKSDASVPGSRSNEGRISWGLIKRLQHGHERQGRYQISPIEKKQQRAVAGVTLFTQSLQETHQRPSLRDQPKLS